MILSSNFFDIMPISLFVGLMSRPDESLFVGLMSRQDGSLFVGLMSRQDLFDVTMGSYDGAETCELIGIYILDGIKSIIRKEDVGTVPR